jgi:hypothetical protein
VSFLSAELEAKRLEVLHELLSHASVVAALVDPSFVTSVDQLNDLQYYCVINGSVSNVERSAHDSMGIGAGGGRWHRSAVGAWSRSSLERAVQAATEDPLGL